MTAYLGPFERLLAATCPLDAVRAAESGGSTAALWDAIAASGFLDALVAEDDGAGLALADVGPLWEALGSHAVPLAIGETMIARMLLRAAGIAAPDGPILLVVAEPGVPAIVPLAQTAGHALVERSGGLSLLPVTPAVAAPVEIAFSLAARLSWPDDALGPQLLAPVGGLRVYAAVLRSAQIAGAIGRITDMTAAYARDRMQFGKPIGQQQAVQQQLALMAEEMVAARMAAQLGYASRKENLLVAGATAKSVAGRSAARAAGIAHAIHGAIGISAEHELNLYTRRLHEWRLAEGSEGYWECLLGRQFLGSGASALDFARDLMPRTPCNDTG
jgi:alkylation response protein AidB-like acyl-CoA dehydrogenase